MGIKIVLVDDDSLIRESFKIMLSYDLAGIQRKLFNFRLKIQ